MIAGRPAAADQVVSGPHRGGARRELRRGERAGRAPEYRGEQAGPQGGPGPRHLHIGALSERQVREVPLTPSRLGIIDYYAQIKSGPMSSPTQCLVAQI